MIDELRRTELDVARVSQWSPIRRKKAALALLDGTPLFDIEVCSSCNDTCPFCPRDAIDRQKQCMSPEIFEGVDAFLPDNAVVMFSGLGEPLLNPHLPSFVARLTQRGISSCVVTNGLLLSLERAASLLEAGLDQFQISYRGEAIGEPSPEGAARMRLRHLDSMLEYLAEAQPSGFRCQINVVWDVLRASDLQAARALAQRYDISLFVRRRHSRGGKVGKRQPGRPDDGCGIFAAVTMITAQGTILACCNDTSGATARGQVIETCWSEILGWKRAVIESDSWFAPCADCDDDYRWVILANGGVNIKDQDEVSTSANWRK